MLFPDHNEQGDSLKIARRRDRPRSFFHLFAIHFFASKPISAVGLTKRSQSKRSRWSIRLCSLRFLLFIQFFLRRTAHAPTFADKSCVADQTTFAFVTPNHTRWLRGRRSATNHTKGHEWRAAPRFVFIGEIRGFFPVASAADDCSPLRSTLIG